MKFLALVAVVTLTACSPQSQIESAIRNNPKIVFQAIEDHPTEFIETVNRAVASAQKKQAEKQVAEVKGRQEEDLKSPKTPRLEEKRRLSGSPRGKIVLVEYADFQCPACGMAYEGLKKFKEVHKNDIQFYYKNMPLSFHKLAMPAAITFEAVFQQGAGKAEKFYDYVFSHQRELAESDFLRKAVMISGADPAKVERDKNSVTVETIMADDLAEFEKFGFTGTPVLIMNGVALEGAQRYEELERVLAMTEARR
jgi:protein-disulfide isomerase